MNTLKRIKQYIDYKGITNQNFEKQVGFSNGAFASQLKNNRTIGVDKLENILIAFPELNPEWLLTGNGEMIKTKSKENATFLNGGINGGVKGGEPNVKKRYAIELAEKPTNTGIEANNLGNAGIPLIPIDAMAGFGTGAVQVMHYDTSKYVVPEFAELNVDFMIRVKGSSMVPKYNSGDLVACKKLVITDIFFQWNKVYVLDTEQGALIKRVKKGSRDNYILLISDNKNYDPFELHLSKIFAVALVVGVIRLE